MARTARPRNGMRIKRLLTLGVVVAGIGAVLRARPAVQSARGTPTTPPSAHAATVGWEPKDIDARGTAFILAGIAATTMLVVGIVFAMVWRFDVARHASWSRLTPPETAQLVPPAPHLQLNPFDDLAQDRGREEQLLHSYGWTSEDHSTARIPIDRAMALSVGKSLDAPP